MGECFFWYRPTRVVPDQRPLNGRCRCCCGTELLETNYRISFLSGPDTWMIGWCHSVGRQMVEVTKPNRNTENIEVAVVNGNLCGGENVRYVHFAELCEKMRQHAKCAAIAYSHKTDMPDEGDF